MNKPTMIDHRPMARRTSSLIAALVVVFVLALSLTNGALAQQNAPNPKPSVNASATIREQAPAAQTRPAISNEQALYLVRSTLLTLNDANRSGNYTVLRDLAGPDFQARNTAADLAQSFADLRRRNFDLFAVALIPSQFTAVPALDENGRMRLTGFFPTRPLQISFDLMFQVTGGQWKLFAISVATPEAPRLQSFNRPPPRPSAKPFYGLRALSGTLGWRW